VSDDNTVNSPTSSGSGSTIGADSTDSEKRSLDILNSDEPTDNTEDVDTSSSDEGETDSEEENLTSNEEVSDSETEDTEAEAEEDVKDEQLTVTGKAAYDRIKKDFPDVLKQVPELRQLFFREKAFSDIYTSVDEARKASADAEFLNGLGSSLESGNIKGVLESLSENSINNLATKLIPTLKANNREAFVRATGPFIADMLNDAYEFGSQTNNADLQKSVLWLSKFLTGKPELPKRLANKEVDPEIRKEREKLEADKQTFYQGQVNGFVTAADSAVYNGLKKALDIGLDPDSSMTSFVKNAIIRDTILEVQELANKDQNFSAMMNELFKRAQRAGFDQDSKSRVVSAYLGRVKDIALKIRARKKAEALGGQRKKEVTNEVQPRRQVQNEAPTRKPIRPIPPGTKPKSELDVIRAR